MGIHCVKYYFRKTSISEFKSGKGSIFVWSNEQIKQWHLRWRTYQTDTSSVMLHKNIDQQRLAVQQDMVQLLQSFLDGAITVKVFNTLFQQKTHGAQNAFNLRGMSGGMFFNKLVKYIHDDEMLACQLQSVLVAPKEIRDGRLLMQSFICFLEELIEGQQVTREQLQPARVPFFLSVWWHMQDSKRWPIFYPLAHAVLLSETERASSPQDVIDQYLVFRTQFLCLAKALDLSSWELEHILTWYGQHHLESLFDKHTIRSMSLNRGTETIPKKHARRIGNKSHTMIQYDMPLEEDRPIHKNGQDTHTHLQWLLAKLGQKVGCSVWIAVNDHQKVWNNERLGDLSLPSLPLFTDSAFQHIIRRIDVLWLCQETIVAAYEIEHTTDIAIGLLRLYDLGALCSHADYLCIVAPRDRFKRIQFELSRPVFHGQEMYHKCRLISEELLLEQEEHMLRWAGSLSVIENMLHPFEESTSR
jgi:hypothetical protein